MTVPAKMLKKWCEIHNATFSWIDTSMIYFGYKKDGMEHKGKVLKALAEVI